MRLKPLVLISTWFCVYSESIFLTQNPHMDPNSDLWFKWLYFQHQSSISRVFLAAKSELRWTSHTWSLDFSPWSTSIPLRLREDCDDGGPVASKSLDVSTFQGTSMSYSMLLMLLLDSKSRRRLDQVAKSSLSNVAGGSSEWESAGKSEQILKRESLCFFRWYPSSGQCLRCRASSNKWFLQLSNFWQFNYQFIVSAQTCLV